MNNNKRVLIVDDEPVSASFLGMALRAEGFDVREATKAADALTLASGFNPEVLVTDWMLKDQIDGIELAAQLLQVLPSMRVIIMTGMALDLVKEKAQGLPYDAIMVKPVEIDELIGSMN